MAATAARSALAAKDIFAENGCHPDMNPLGLDRRESRDSEAHPDSVGIVFALDVSGSMGEIPELLARRTLPTFMAAVLEVLADPQLMFLAFGNAGADRSPLQVGQFESDAEAMDRFLAATHLEGGGGGLGESYDLAMLVGARHTSMDCLETRGRKGYFFMTGDEVPFTAVDHTVANRVLGSALAANIPIHTIAAELLESFHVFFLIPDPAREAPFGTGDTWRTLLGARTVVLAAPEDMAVVCALLVAVTEGSLRDIDGIRARLESSATLGRQGEAAERVLRAVTPYLEAFTRGTLGPPAVLGTQPDPGFRG